MYSNVVPDLGTTKGGGRQREANRVYAHLLPILLSPPEQANTWLARVGLFAFRRNQIENPHCEGYFDMSSRSVWVTNSSHSATLWRRGFFGKGSLSRSEPSWVVRTMHEQQQRAEKVMTAEQVTAKRRAERNQFKRDRAQAFAAALAEAEASFAAGDTSVKIAPLTREAVANFVAKRIDHSYTAELQTSDAEHGVDSSMVHESRDESGTSEELLSMDLEHLQLTLQEAYFLTWSLDCLQIVNPNTGNTISLNNVWTLFQRASFPLSTITSATFRFDNPFLINYAVYHHYRSLGWVVRSGVKFCTDYLLYRRGPVFHHAEFAITVCPVYEDPEDRENSPFDLANSTPFSWSWLSTMSRVNTQVQKTLILTYVTIPSSRRVSAAVLLSPACLAHYSLREVVLRRFVPARMRD